MPDGQVENQHKCNEQTVVAGWISRGASRFQIYMPAGQVDIFHVVSPCIKAGSTVTPNDVTSMKLICGIVLQG